MKNNDWIFDTFWKKSNYIYSREERVENLLEEIVRGKLDQYTTDDQWQIITRIYQGGAYTGNLDMWHEIFTGVGDFDTKTKLWLKDGPKTVYRAAHVPLGMYGHSWTEDLDIARWFANRLGSVGRPEGMIFTTTATKDNTWCYVGNTDACQDESEVLLCITRLGPECEDSEDIRELEDKIQQQYDNEQWWKVA